MSALLNWNRIFQNRPACTFQDSDCPQERCAWDLKTEKTHSCTFYALKFGAGCWSLWQPVVSAVTHLLACFGGGPAASSACPGLAASASLFPEREHVLLCVHGVSFSCLSPVSLRLDVERERRRPQFILAVTYFTPSCPAYLSQLQAPCHMQTVRSGFTSRVEVLLLWST